jgi:hypothetical protein
MLGVDDWIHPKPARHEEPDIDQLVPEVERAMWASRNGKERFDAEQETLGRDL